MTSPLLLAQGLRKRLGERLLWHGISIDLRAGERLALVGPAGCGKTLLLRQLAWLDPPDGGQVLLRGQPPQAWTLPRYRAQVAYLAQRPPVFAGTVAQNLAEPWTYRCHQGRSPQPERLLAWLAQLGRDPTFLGQAAGLLSGEVTSSRAGEQFTVLAETLLRRLFIAVRAEFEKRHGVVPGAPVGLLGFGKMASREMTFTSDLDFIMLYDAAVTDMSDGERPLAAGHYFARLTQRLIAAVSAPTAEGVLYETDMRLRPSGNAGPLATSLAGFVDYHRESAWTWEHLALARARIVTADSGMGTRIEAAIAAQMAAPRDKAKTIVDVVAMRDLMARERKPRHAFDLKLATGGLVDLEFIAQSAQLVAGLTLGVPQAPTAIVLARLGDTGLVPEGERLVEIHGIYSTVLQVMSAALLHPFRDEAWSQPFKDLLARLTGYPTFDLLLADIAAMQDEVSASARKWYERAASL